MSELPSFFVGPLELRRHADGRVNLFGDVRESDHVGELDPVPPMIRAANLAGYAMIGVRHDQFEEPGICRFTGSLVPLEERRDPSSTAGRGRREAAP